MKKYFSVLSFSKLVVTFSLLTGAGAIAAYSFGVPGQSGYDGSSGRDGRDGQDVVLQVTGQSENLNLTGEDGSNGSDGSPGSSAYNCYSGTPNYDLVGADGGRGGDGGRAGQGGDGGSVRLYYEDAANLKKVFIDSTPGRSGYSGRGAQGGYGCQCSIRYWTNTICHQESRQVTTCNPRGCSAGTEGCACRTHTEYYQVCRDHSFSCYDGDSGRHGVSGGGERDGAYGTIELVQRLEPLESTAPSRSESVDTLLNDRFELTRHEWNSLDGASSLFAAGSRVRSGYSQYAGKTIRFVQFKWLDTIRPVEYYRGHSVSMSLQGKPARTVVDFPNSVLVDSKSQIVGDTMTVQVERSMKRQELTSLRVEELVGSGQNLELVLIDDANVSDISNTKVYIKSDWDLEAGGEWENFVPDDLVRADITGAKHKIRVNIGRLPGIKAKKIAKYFSEKCEFEMKVLRSFAGTEERVVRDGGNTFEIEKDLKKSKPIEVKMDNESW
jgi:hypothetical protein